MNNNAPYPWTTDGRRKIMRAVRGKGNKSTELKFCKALTEAGIIGWRTQEKIEGRPDVYFPWYKIAIFVDGCFWHGCPTCGHIPKTNHTYWEGKIAANKERDLIKNSMLVGQGYSVLRFWEHQLAYEIENCIGVVGEAIERFFYMMNIDNEF